MSAPHSENLVSMGTRVVPVSQTMTAAGDRNPVRFVLTPDLTLLGHRKISVLSRTDVPLSGEVDSGPRPPRFMLNSILFATDFARQKLQYAPASTSSTHEAVVATFADRRREIENTSSDFKVVSYNIKHGIGNDGQLDL